MTDVSEPVTVSSYRSGWSIGRKVSAIIAMAIIGGFAVLEGLQFTQKRAELHNEASAQFQTITELLGSQMAGGVRWKRSKAVTRTYKKFSDDPASDLASLTTFDIDGNALTQFDSARLDRIELAAVVKQNAKALGNGHVIKHVTPDHVIVVLPLSTGKQRLRVGTLAAAWSLDRLNRQFRTGAGKDLLVDSALLLFVLTLLVSVMNRLVSRPIQSMTGLMAQLAAGDRDVEVRFAGRRDELGALASAFNVFKDKLLENER